jgi:hypothetical protein
VTTHLRGRAAQAGALLAVVVGGIAVAPAVALAAPPDVEITSLPTDVLSGGSVTLKYRVTNNSDDENPGGGGAQRRLANIQISGMDCAQRPCSQIAEVSEREEFTAQLKAPEVQAGQKRDVQIQINVRINNESGQPATSTVTVKGPDKPQSVRQITGKVKDQDGKGISNASVGIQDSQGNRLQGQTNGSGGYSITSTDSKPIAPGDISVGAGKDGYDPASVKVQGEAGRTVNVSLTLKEIASTASPSASASASASAEASEDATDETTAPSETTAAADPNAEKTAANQDDGGSSWLYILIGGLLVAAGVGAMVLVFLRRKNSGGDGDDDDPTGLGGPGGIVPPSQGRFNDATRVAAPVGGGVSSATMVAPRSGAPSISDAPTMLHRPVPVEDEFPDPYGAAVPPQGGYLGTPAAGWDDQPYAEPNQYGAAPADDGYGPGTAAGYGAAAQPYGGGQAPQQRYDEPTGLYQPATDDDAAGYGDYDRGGYGGGQQQPYGGGTYGGAGAAPAPGTYGGGGAQQYGGGYDQPGAGGGYPDQGGYDQDNGGAHGYGPQSGGTYGGAAPAGTYGGGAGSGGGAGQQYGAGGYDQPAGYGDQGGYDQRGGAYGGGAAGGGYDQPAGHDEQQPYDDQGGRPQRGNAYGGPPRQEPSHPGQRRSREWDN